MSSHKTAMAEPISGCADRHAADEVNRAERLRPLHRGGAIVGAVALLLLGLHIYHGTIAAPPYDLRVFGQTKLHAGTDAALRIAVLNAPAKLALADVPVQIAIHDPQAKQWVQLAQFTTNEQGTGQPHFRLPEWSEGEYQLRVTANTPTPQVVTHTVRLTRSWKLMLSSDRPVYQPGQTIHARALALHNLDLKPVAGLTAVFTLTDPKGNVLFKQKEITSKFGICAIDCPLAHEILEGTYTIACQLGDTASKLGVEVKKYVLPKFKIELAADKPYYEPGQRVEGKVHAAYFFGKPVAGGTVELTLCGGEEIPKLDQTLTLKTNDKGQLAFSFPPLPGHLLDGKDGVDRLELTATVMDVAGQKQARKLPILVSRQPLRIDVIPEAGTLAHGLRNTVYVFVRTADGKPAKARVAISELDNELTTSELGVASFEYTPIEQTVMWAVRATDAEGRSARRDVTIACNAASEDFLVRTDRAVYSGGDTVQLTALGGGHEPIFVDLIKDGQTLLTQAIPMADGQGERRFDLSPELAGTFQLSAYRLTGKGVPLRKTRVLYVRPAGQLNVVAKPDQNEYRPGGQANLQFTLTDKDGKPTPGALSLAAVDEAVFAVLEQATGMEQNFFTVTPGLLASAQALYPGALNVPDSGQEERTLGNAVFATTASTSAVIPSGDVSDPVVMPGEYVTTTFFRNQTESRRHREMIRRALKVSWILLAIAAGFLAYIGFWCYCGKGVVVFAHIAAVVGFILYSLGGGFDPRWGRYDQVAWQEACDPCDGRALLGDWGGGVLGWDGGVGVGPPAQARQDVIKHFPAALIPPTTTADPPRVRDWFPETLLWRPELITDDRGRASLEISLADSITTWRLTGSAVTSDGRLGALQEKIKVFQSFFVDVNLPVALTREDEIAVPVVVYNYLDKAQEVEVTLVDAPWFTRLEKSATRKIALGPNEVRSTHFRLRAAKVGVHELQVNATGAGVADAVKRRVEVIPDGRKVETVWNGTLSQPAELGIAVPADAIEGSPKLFVKFYPSKFSQLVEGLDGIFRLPYGCFEQTSSTTYPNVLALDYLRRTKKSLPAVESKARHYIHLGYQRLVGFEVAGGGFDWFGRPPANRTLTAYGLMEFEDMAKVHEVDPNLIARTRKWLLDERQRDGSWAAERGMVNDGLAGNVQAGKDVNLSTTAYIAWAVFSGSSADAGPTRQFLLAHGRAAIGDPHTLALVCNALLAIDPKGRDAQPYLNRLVALRQSSPDGKSSWWQASGRTTFHGSGRSGSVETTALAALALLRSGHEPAVARSALAWLVQARDGAGTWHSTQATVLALKALLAGTDAQAGDGERHLEIAWNGKQHALTVPADQAEVMKLVDLSSDLGSGKHTLKLTETTATAANYQVVFRYHVPGEIPKAGAPFAIAVHYEREQLRVDETVQATAKIVNQMKEAAPMTMVELPLPAGFVVLADDFREHVEKGRIAKFEVQPRRVLVYLRELAAGQTLELPYRLRATLAGQVAVAPARVYEYYNPDRQASSSIARLTVE